VHQARLRGLAALHPRPGPLHQRGERLHPDLARGQARHGVDDDAGRPGQQVEQVLALAATLLGGPPAGTFVGIGGARWDLGAPLSGPVAEALPAVAAAIAAAVEALYCG
jgi:hypothetical protein